VKPGQTPDKEEKENVEKIKITIEEDIEKRLFEPRFPYFKRIYLDPLCNNAR
jgi:hypothetical protein